jgi:hypothetical protein
MRNGAPTKRRMGDKANCYEVAKQNSPGLQPWVASKKDRPEGATDGLLGRGTILATPGGRRQQANTIFVRAPFQGAANVVDKPRAKALGYFIEPLPGNRRFTGTPIRPVATRSLPLRSFCRRAPSGILRDSADARTSESRVLSRFGALLR